MASLAQAKLTDVERRALDRFVELACRELEADLRAVCRLDAQLPTRAQKTREAREEADYGVGGANAEEAETMIADAEGCIADVEALLD